MILIILFVLSLFLAIDIHGFNRIFDVFVPLYFIGALVTVVLSGLKEYRKSSEEEEVSLKPYVYTKKPKFDPSDWKGRIFGKWDKIERTNFYEVRVCRLTSDECS